MVMLTTYYQYYDQLLFLVVLYPFALRLPKRFAMPVLIVNVMQFLPIHGLISHIPVFRSSLAFFLLFQPLVVLTTATLLLFAPRSPQDRIPTNLT
jgi:hypothetical protein